MKKCLPLVASLCLLLLSNMGVASDPSEREVAAWAREAKRNPKKWGYPPRDREKFFAWVEERVCAIKGFCKTGEYPDELSPYSHDENGCSAPTGDLWFRDPCNGHDNCYQHGFQCGLSRKQCDDQLLSGSLDVCGSLAAPESWRCRQMAWIYYVFVRAFGWKYYHVDPWTNAGAQNLTCSPEVTDCSSYALAADDHFCTVYVDPASPTLQCPNGTVTLTATGGRGPYVWSTSAGTLTWSGSNNEVATLAPLDPGTGTYAYSRTVSAVYAKTEAFPACTIKESPHVIYNCAGEFVMCYYGSICCGAYQFLHYPVVDPMCVYGRSGDCGLDPSNDPVWLCEKAENGVLADHRAEMGYTDCHPCILEMDGAVVMVADQDGHQAQAVVSVR